MGCCNRNHNSPTPQQPMKKTLVQKVVDKFKFVGPTVRQERLGLCLVCPKLKVIKKDYVSLCRVCNCVVEGKTWLADQECPLQKWMKA